MKRSYRILLFVILPAVVLAAALAPAALAYTSHSPYHQSGGTGSLVDVMIYGVDQEAAVVENAGTLNVSDSVLRTDTSGLSLAATGTVLARSGSSITLAFTNIWSYGNSTYQGAQGVYSTGPGTVVTLNSCHVEGNSYAARGLYTTFGGQIVANYSSAITFKGGGGAAVATSGNDGGTIVLNGGTFLSYGGMGSAVFYSTGTITANDVYGHAFAAEGACVDGGHSLTLTGGSDLSAWANNGVSFAKSPFATIVDGTSVFNLTDSSLWARKNLFYAPNSKAVINLSNSTVYTDLGVILTTIYSGGGPGNDPDRGSSVDLNARGTSMAGDILSDRESVVNVSIRNHTVFTGAINPTSFFPGLERESQSAEPLQITKRVPFPVVNVTIDGTSTWNVTEDSYVAGLTLPPLTKGPLGRFFEGFGAVIQSHGHDVYYDDYNSKNAWLKHQFIGLPGGGYLVPWSKVKA